MRLTDYSSRREFLRSAVMLAGAGVTAPLWAAMKYDRDGVMRYFREQASETDARVKSGIVRNLYSVWFSHKAMEAIIYWDLSDAYTWQPASFGSLLRRDMSPKPAYDVVRDLFGREWRTNFERDAAGGRLSFRGFCGTYEVEATSNGRTVKREFHVGRENPGPVEITV